MATIKYKKKVFFQFNQKSLIKKNKKNPIWDYFNSNSEPTGRSMLLKHKVNGHMDIF